MIEKLFYILIAYIPFQIALNPYQDIDLMSGRVLILALFFYWLWTIRNSSKTDIRIRESSVLAANKNNKIFNFQSILLLVFLFLSFVSLSQAKEVFWGIRKILVFCSIFPLYFLTVGIIDNLEKVKGTFKILVFCSLPIAIIGIFQFLAQFIFTAGEAMNFLTKWIAPVFYGRSFGWLVSANPSWLMELGGQFYLRAISIFPDPHTFAFYLGLIIPLAVSLLFFAKENRKMLLVVCCSLIVSLLLTFSRGGYFAMLTTMTFFGLFFLLKSKLFKISSKHKILLFIVYCLLFIVLLVPITPISRCFYSSFDSLRYSNIERIKVWNESLDAISEHPWFGVGIGNFPKFVDPWAKYLSPINAHSLYLDIASEVGIFALWAWLFLFFGTILLLLKNARIYSDEDADSLGFAISLGLAGSLIWFSCHALVETPIYNPTILAILMLILGLSSVVINLRTNKPN